jgi:hypothetical protein
MKKKNESNLRTFRLQTHFKEHIVFVSWGSLVFKETLLAPWIIEPLKGIMIT